MAVSKVIESSEIQISDLMILSTAEDMMSDFTHRIKQGLELDQYLQFTNQTREKLVEQFKDQAVKRIKTRLTLEAIVKAEASQLPNEEEMDKKYTELAEQYKMDKEELIKMIPETDKEAISLDIAVQKAIDFIIKNARLSRVM